MKYTIETLTSIYQNSDYVKSDDIVEYNIQVDKMPNCCKGCPNYKEGQLNICFCVLPATTNIKFKITN